ncbi:receptor-like protein EIX2 [Vitis riparia]|uniref:receptor-like protein EIX2 n=1 Tax=Vitis riparia TaxID=96939 RepID=UPI00155AFACD|nr:receptor-like protein EIX2 [Vitis riparia]
MAGWSFQHLLSFLMLLLLCAKPGLGNVTGCIERERKALLHFKRRLVDDYGLLSSWRDEHDNRNCCNWRGVQCSNQSGHVIMLHLQAPWSENAYEYQSLRGEISPSLLELEHLTHLDLSCNDFEGRHIPPFLGSLSRMQYLNLSHANFNHTVPTQLGNLSNLFSLDLSDDYDYYRSSNSGNLEWLSRLSSLRFLDLSNVHLSEAIHWSQAINKLPSLIHLDLRGCDLSPIPPLTIPSLSHGNSSVPLVFLDLSGNYLTSSIYPWLLNFSTTLLHLDLSFNGLNGSIPEYAFGNMSSLEYLDLHSSELDDEIPDTIRDMGSLAYLDLSENQLWGSIPDTVGKMVSLSHLDLSYNQLQGSIPDTVGKMVLLSHLYLSGNQLQGSIPDTVGKMVLLSRLDLSYNQLQGSIPDTIGNMVLLSHLDLSHNQLQGFIPDTVGNMVSLENLYLFQNHLQGEIPKSLSNLCNLQELELERNNLSGQLTPDFVACANDTLEILSLWDNQFSGSVPALIGFSSLRELRLDFNQLNGTLPESVGQLANLQYLDIASNLLQGTISEAHLFNLSQLSYLDLSSNALTFNMSLEWVPPFQLYSLRLASCKLGPRFPSWLRTQNQLSELDISNSEISDVLPDWFWNVTSTVNTLNISNNQINGTLPNLPQLPYQVRWWDFSDNKLSGSISLLCTVGEELLLLDLSNNSLSGGLPNCWVQWKSLAVLNLENNRFSGQIPNSFGSLRSIRTLHLRNNNLTGELPLSFKNCTSLRFIDLAKNRLSGKIPEWIGGSLPNLIVLNLGSNRFSGGISPELCQLKNIQILDLSSNNMLGVVPRCVGSFTAMTKKGSLVIAHNYSFTNIGGCGYMGCMPRNASYVDRALVKWKAREFDFKSTLGLVKSIDLSSNKLWGEIPEEVIDLVELVSLNLSRNNLTGLIPARIGQLKSLEVLDLSQNHLFGEIPTSLVEISGLSVLDLSDNNLSGKIPQGTQLQSFDNDSYKGNPTLCGLPLLKKCSEDKIKQDSPTHNIEDKIQQDGNDMWFYVSIALGFIVGFWGDCNFVLAILAWLNANRCVLPSMINLGM